MVSHPASGCVSNERINIIISFIHLANPVPQIPHGKFVLSLHVLHRKSNLNYKPHSVWSFLPCEQMSGGVKGWLVKVGADKGQ